MKPQRVDVMHGVNLDQIGRRDPAHYGHFTFTELEVRVKKFARDLGLEATFWQTNHEGEFCETLHIAAERTDGLLLNPGAWTHYSYAIRDALELCAVPAVEVHLSAIDQREEWRRRSVIRDLCVGSVQGKGLDGYREALEILKAAMTEGEESG
jgi:3-dehydroquinate dehydratase-2